MRKSILFLAIVLVASTLSVNAQSSSDTYSVGTNVVSLGIGLGSSFGPNVGSSTPALSLQYERGLWEAGPGVISLGGYVGYKGYKYTYFDETVKWNYSIIGVRGAWHWTGSGIDNLDLYGGAMLAYNHVSTSVSDASGTYTNGYGSYGSDLGLSLFVGGRYYFTPQLGAFAELGYGIAYLNIGLALKF